MMTQFKLTYNSIRQHLRQVYIYLLKPFTFSESSRLMVYSLTLMCTLSIDRIIFYRTFIWSTIVKPFWLTFQIKIWSEDTLFFYKVLLTMKFFLSLVLKVIILYKRQFNNVGRKFKLWYNGLTIVSLKQILKKCILDIAYLYVCLGAFTFGFFCQITATFLNYKYYRDLLTYRFFEISLLLRTGFLAHVQSTLTVIEYFHNIQISKKKTLFSKWSLDNIFFFIRSLKSFVISTITVRLHDSQISEFIELGYPTTWDVQYRLIAGVYSNDGYFFWSLARIADYNIGSRLEKYLQLPKYLIPGNNTSPTPHLEQIVNYINSQVLSVKDTALAETILNEFYFIFQEHFKAVLEEELRRDPYALIRLKLITPNLESPHLNALFSEYLFDVSLIERICEYWQFVNLSETSPLLSKLVPVNPKIVRNKEDILELFRFKTPTKLTWYDDCVLIWEQFLEILILKYYVYFPFVKVFGNMNHPRHIWENVIIIAPLFSTPLNIALQDTFLIPWLLFFGITSAIYVHYAVEPSIFDEDLTLHRDEYWQFRRDWLGRIGFEPEELSDWFVWLWGWYMIPFYVEWFRLPYLRRRLTLLYDVDFARYVRKVHHRRMPLSHHAYDQALISTTEDTVIFTDPITKMSAPETSPIVTMHETVAFSDRYMKRHRQSTHHIYQSPDDLNPPYAMYILRKYAANTMTAGLGYLEQDWMTTSCKLVPTRIYFAANYQEYLTVPSVIQYIKYLTSEFPIHKMDKAGVDVVEARDEIKEPRFQLRLFFWLPTGYWSRPEKRNIKNAVIAVKHEQVETLVKKAKKIQQEYENYLNSFLNTVERNRQLQKIIKLSIKEEQFLAHIKSICRLKESGDYRLLNDEQHLFPISQNSQDTLFNKKVRFTENMWVSEKTKVLQYEIQNMTTGFQANISSYFHQLNHYLDFDFEGSFTYPYSQKNIWKSWSPKLTYKNLKSAVDRLELTYRAARKTVDYVRPSASYLHNNLTVPKLYTAPDVVNETFVQNKFKNYTKFKATATKKFTRWWVSQDQEKNLPVLFLQRPTPVGQTGKLREVNYWRPRLFEFIRLWFGRKRYELAFYQLTNWDRKRWFKGFNTMAMNRLSTSASHNVYSRMPGAKRVGLYISYYDWWAIYDNFKERLYGSFGRLPLEGEFSVDSDIIISEKTKKDERKTKMKVQYLLERYDVLFDKPGYMATTDDFMNTLVDQMSVGMYNYSFPTTYIKDVAKKTVKEWYDLDLRFTSLLRADEAQFQRPSDLDHVNIPWDTRRRTPPHNIDLEVMQDYVAEEDFAYQDWKKHIRKRNILETLKTLDLELFDSLFTVSRGADIATGASATQSYDYRIREGSISRVAGFPRLFRLKHFHQGRKPLKISSPLALMQAQTGPSVESQLYTYDLIKTQNLHSVLAAVYTQFITQMMTHERALSTHYWFTLKSDVHDYFSYDLDRLRYARNKNLSVGVDLFEQFQTVLGQSWDSQARNQLYFDYARTLRKEHWKRWMNRLAWVSPYWNRHLPGLIHNNNGIFNTHFFRQFRKSQNHVLTNRASLARGPEFLNILSAIEHIEDASERINIITGMLQENFVGVNSSVWFDFFFNDLAAYLRLERPPLLTDYQDIDLDLEQSLPGTMLTPRAFRNHFIDLEEYKKNKIDRRYFFDSICLFVESMDRLTKLGPLPESIRTTPLFKRMIDSNQGDPYPFNVTRPLPSIINRWEGITDCLLLNDEEKLAIEDLFYEYEVPPVKKAWIGDELRRKDSGLNNKDIASIEYTTSIESFLKKAGGTLHLKLHSFGRFMNRLLYSIKHPYTNVGFGGFYPNDYIKWATKTTDMDDWKQEQVATMGGLVRDRVPKFNHLHIQKSSQLVLEVFGQYEMFRDNLIDETPLLVAETGNSFADLKKTEYDFARKFQRIKRLCEEYAVKNIIPIQDVFPRKWKLRQFARLRELYHVYLTVENSRIFPDQVVNTTLANEIARDVLLPNLDAELETAVSCKFTKTLLHAPNSMNFLYFPESRYDFIRPLERREKKRQEEEEILRAQQAFIEKEYAGRYNTFIREELLGPILLKFETVNASRNEELFTPQVDYFPKRKIFENHIEAWSFLDLTHEVQFNDSFFDELDEPLLRAVANNNLFLVSADKVRDFTYLLDKGLHGFAYSTKSHSTESVFNAGSGKSNFEYTGTNDLYRDETRFSELGFQDRFRDPRLTMFSRQFGNRKFTFQRAHQTGWRYDTYRKSFEQHVARVKHMAGSRERVTFLVGLGKDLSFAGFDGWFLNWQNVVTETEAVFDSGFPDNVVEYYKWPQFFVPWRRSTPGLNETRDHALLAGFYNSTQLMPTPLHELVQVTGSSTSLNLFSIYCSSQMSARAMEWFDIYDPVTERIVVNRGSQTSLKEGGMFLKRYYGYTRPLTLDYKLRNASALIENIDHIANGFVELESLVGLEFALTQYLTKYFGMLPYNVLEYITYITYWGHNWLQAIYHGSFIESHVQQLVSIRPKEGLLDVSFDYNTIEMHKRKVYRESLEKKIEIFEIEQVLNDQLRKKEKVYLYEHNTKSVFEFMKDALKPKVMVATITDLAKPYVKPIIGPMADVINNIRKRVGW